ncbi:MAG: hypothetical protein IH822_06365 [Chloroflexi bacterium]|nr:hypothetical protein [Chloroflexota bacterium]
MKRSFEQALEYGREGERRIMERLRAMGVLVTPKADYVGPGRAPEQRSNDEYLTPCDLDCAHRGAAFGLQVKRKKEPTFTRMTSTWDHGFEQAHYTMYQRWQAACGIRLALCVTEDCSADGGPGEDLYSWIDDLKVRHQWYDNRHMVYFPRAILTSIKPFLDSVVDPGPGYLEPRLL